MAFEEKQLIANNRDFRMLLNEYYEGILLFEIMNQKVWGKAVEDTVGLQAYFDNNRESYVWGQRINATIFESANQNIIKSVKNQLDQAPYLLKEISITPDDDVISHTGIAHRRGNSYYPESESNAGS